MIFTTNSSFCPVQHPQFGKTSRHWPGYTPTSTQQTADEYLPMTCEKEYEKCANDLKNKTVCLAIAGWSNIHSEPIICVTVTTSTGQTNLIDTVTRQASATLLSTFYNLHNLLSKNVKKILVVVLAVW